jgi:hypothetical protein
MKASAKHHQKYCSKPDCQAARKRNNAEGFRKRNPDYWRSKHNVRRVQEWRRNNPGYWRKEKSGSGEAADRPVLTDDALQTADAPESVDDKVDKLSLTVDALQTVIAKQHVVLHGIACDLTGNVLQTGLGAVVNSWYDKGRQASVPDLSFIIQSQNGGSIDESRTELCAVSRADPADSGAFQLGGPAGGP